MKKNYLLAAALAIMTMASCSDNEFIGDKSLMENNGSGGAISFNLNVPAITRADDKTGAEAAADLNYQFIVWGEKNEAGNGSSAGASNLVFENYKVEYTANTAYNTTSNTKNWEYVGLTPYTQVTPNLTSTQTIKYWDFGATKYTFTAVSALPDDITGGKVVIAKNQTGASSSDFNKGYEIEVKTDAALDKIFVADRNVIMKADAGTNREAVNKYGGNVTMKFRNFMSKIRFGIYETIPGYKVKITKVYYNSTNSTANFGVDGKFLTVGNGSTTHTQFTVTYENSTNKAIVNVKSGTTPVTNSYFETAPGTVDPIETSVPFLSADYIGTTATGATFNKTVKDGSNDAVNGVYTTIIPFTSNDTNIKLKIDYKLISEDTNEEINIEEKTAEIPATYCQWKNNYAYTYLFKITDDDLYPITFDAVEVVDEDGKAEYITTVNEPSITTFGVKDSKYVTGKDEYENGSDIYATFVKGNAVQTPSLTESTKANYVKIYQVTTSDATNFPITEASVAERLAETPLGTAKLTCTDISTDVTATYFNSVAPAVVTTVPAEDGTTTKTIDAVKLTGVKTNTYAIEFVTYEAVTLTDGDALDGYYAENSGTYTKQNGGTYSSGTYYKQVKTYKVIKVVTAPNP